ncbi:MAG: tRNA preQ1(34) S-adenosylmethionine ribosyltransferase-isomerase QueA, partial [candidate division WOR-3 bacterium]
MLVAEFDYHLPKELIAQEPIEPRDASRLLVVDRKSKEFYEARFSEIGNWLSPGDLLVVNDTKVIPARLFGVLPTGGKMEFLLLRRIEPGVWETLTRPARKARVGTRVKFDRFEGLILSRQEKGVRIVRFEPGDIDHFLWTKGEIALPPYIRQKCERPDRYQTVYARSPGAVAAPTAGLHFTPELLKKIADKGVRIASITLHAGLGTFRPVKAERVEEHQMYPEEFELTLETARVVNRALEEKRRVVCVGTTVVRVLEGQAIMSDGKVQVQPGRGLTSLYIYPGYQWK